MVKPRSSKPISGVRSSLLLLFRKLRAHQLIRQVAFQKRRLFWRRLRHWTHHSVKFWFRYSGLLLNLNNIFTSQNRSSFLGLQRIPTKLPQIFIRLFCNWAGSFFFFSLNLLFISFFSTPQTPLTTKDYLMGEFFFLPKRLTNLTYLAPTKLIIRQRTPHIDLKANNRVAKVALSSTPILDLLPSRFTLVVEKTRNYFFNLSRKYPRHLYFRLKRRLSFREQLKYRFKFFLFLRRGVFLGCSFFLRRNRIYPKSHKARRILQSWRVALSRLGQGRTYVFSLYSWRRIILRGRRIPFRFFLSLFFLLKPTPATNNAQLRSIPGMPGIVFFLFFRLTRPLIKTHSWRYKSSYTFLKNLMICYTFINYKSTYRLRTKRPSPYLPKPGFLSWNRKHLVFFLRPLRSYRRRFLLSTFKRITSSLSSSVPYQLQFRMIRKCLPWRAFFTFLRVRAFWYQTSFFFNKGLVSTASSQALKSYRRYIKFYYLTNKRFKSNWRGIRALPQLTLDKNTLTIPTLNNPKAHHVYSFLRLQLFYSTTLLDFITKPQVTLGLSFFSPVVTDWRKYLEQSKKNKPQKRIFKPLKNHYLSSYFTQHINRFFEYFLNSRVGVLLNFEMINRLALSEYFFLEIMKARLRTANSLFSTIFFINEYLDLLFMALKLKNFTHLVNYLNRILKSLIIHDHKFFLVFFFSSFREQFFPFFTELGVVGIHMIIKGKIGVGGNSRKRSMRLRLGVTSRTHRFVNTHTLNTWLNTSTGALGFRVFLYYKNPITHAN